MKATATILSFYKYDPTIFDGLRLPPKVDRSVVISNLVTELAGLEILYPDPTFLRYAISRWADARYDAWLRMYEALSLDYNPLHNYDRTEEFDGQASGNSTTKSPVYDDATLVNTGEIGSDSNSHSKSRTYGNIGVTTSSQMLEGEITVRSRYDFDSIIIDEFKKRFCIMVY